MHFQNILLIDDDEEDQEIFVAALNNLAAEVEFNWYSDARKALEKLAKGDLAPEIIFLDLNMPLMTGQQFLALIKQNSKLSHIPVVVFSTSSQPDIIQQTKELGAHDFVTKPNDFNHFINVLKPFVALASK